MTTTQAPPEVINLIAPVEIRQAAGDKPARIEILAYSGGIATPPGWGDAIHDLDGLELPGQVPILIDHENTVRAVVGQGTPRVVDGRLIVTGQVTRATDAGRLVLALAAEGITLSASIATLPSKVQAIQPGEKLSINGRVFKIERPTLLIRAAKLLEVTVTPVAADPMTLVKIVQSVTSLKGTPMPQTAPVSEPQTAPAPEAEPVAQIRQRAAAETRRIGAIRQACAGRFPEIEARAIEQGWEPQRAELEVLRASRPTLPAIYSGAGGDVSPRKTLTAAVLMHMGCEKLAEKELGAEACQRARDLRATSLLDLCRQSLFVNDIEPERGTNALIRQSFSSMNLPVALGDAANKLVLESYHDTPATWRSFCAIKSAVDFKDHKAVRISHVGNLAAVGPDGELTHENVAESTYSFSIGTFGKQLRVTRQAIINDDLSVFDDTARALGDMAARKLSDTIYGVLMGADAATFFNDSAHANRISGATTNLTPVGLEQAFSAMLTQRDAQGNDLDMTPKTLLVPPELATAARMCLYSDYIAYPADADPTPSGNSFKNALSLEIEPRLSNDLKFDNASAKRWYMFADATKAPLIVAFLNGVESPTVEFFGLDSDPDTLGVSWRVYHDFGCAFGDWRAAILSDGE